jgi:hypothetical protein
MKEGGKEGQVGKGRKGGIKGRSGKEGRKEGWKAGIEERKGPKECVAGTAGSGRERKGLPANTNKVRPPRAAPVGKKKKVGMTVAPGWTKNKNKIYLSFWSTETHHHSECLPSSEGVVSLPLFCLSSVRPFRTPPLSVPPSFRFS